MIFLRRSNVGFAPILGIVVNVRDERAPIFFLVRNADYPEFLPELVFGQGFWTKEFGKEFRAVEKGVGYLSASHGGGDIRANWQWLLQSCVVNFGRSALFGQRCYWKAISAKTPALRAEAAVPRVVGARAIILWGTSFRLRAHVSGKREQVTNLFLTHPS